MKPTRIRTIVQKMTTEGTYRRSQLSSLKSAAPLPADGWGASSEDAPSPDAGEGWNEVEETPDVPHLPQKHPAKTIGSILT